jgi:hypothetical protein
MSDKKQPQKTTPAAPGSLPFPQDGQEPVKAAETPPAASGGPTKARRKLSTVLQVMAKLEQEMEPLSERDRLTVLGWMNSQYGPRYEIAQGFLPGVSIGEELTPETRRRMLEGGR